MQKYLDILGISYGLSLDEIKKAYLKKSMEYHPDRNHGFQKEAEEKMKAINSAWDYIREHFSEYQNMNTAKTNGDSSNSNKSTKTDNGDTQANGAGFKIVVTIAGLLTWSFAQSITTNVFYDIYALLHDYFDGFIIRTVSNPYILSVGLLLWAGFSLAKNKTGKKIVIGLIILNLLIIGYKLMNIWESNRVSEKPSIQKSIEGYKKSPYDVYINGIVPRLVERTKDSITLEWDEVPGVTAYVVKYSKSSVALSKNQDAQYDNATDYITATGVTITNLSSTKERLTPNTTYYFSIVTTNILGFQSFRFGDELSVTTLENSSNIGVNSNTNTDIITDPDLLLKKLNPVITKLNDASYRLQWNKIEGVKEYNISITNVKRKEIANEKCEKEEKLPTDSLTHLLCLYNEEVKAEKQGKPISFYPNVGPDNYILINNFESNQEYILQTIVHYGGVKYTTSSEFVFYTK